MKRLYVCGPMTGLPLLNYPAFHAAAADLRSQGYQVENPAEGPAEASYEAYLCRGLLQLLTCDTVALLPGWERSRGARIEHQVAQTLGMRIETLSGFVPQPVCAPVVLAPASRLFMSSTAA